MRFQPRNLPDPYQRGPEPLGCRLPRPCNTTKNQHWQAWAGSAPPAKLTKTKGEPLQRRQHCCRTPLSWQFHHLLLDGKLNRLWIIVGGMAEAGKTVAKTATWSTLGSALCLTSKQKFIGWHMRPTSSSLHGGDTQRSLHGGLAARVDPPLAWNITGAAEPSLMKARCQHHHQPQHLRKKEAS